MSNIHRKREYPCQMPNCCNPSVLATSITEIEGDRMLDTIFEYCLDHKREEVKVVVDKMSDDFHSGKVTGMRFKIVK